MLASYKKKKEIILSILVIILDGIISYFVPIYLDNSNYFFPMLTISLLPFLYKNNLKDYYSLCFIIGIIYDLLYSNIFLYNALLFLFLAKIDSKVLKVFKESIALYIILVILNIVLYDGITFLLVTLTKYADLSFASLIYKLKCSMLLNIMSAFVYYFLFKKHTRLS